MQRVKLHPLVPALVLLQPVVGRSVGLVAGAPVVVRPVPRNMAVTRHLYLRVVVFVVAIRLSFLLVLKPVFWLQDVLVMKVVFAVAVSKYLRIPRLPVLVRRHVRVVVLLARVPVTLAPSFSCQKVGLVKHGRRPRQPDGGDWLVALELVVRRKPCQVRHTSVVVRRVKAGYGRLFYNAAPTDRLVPVLPIPFLPFPPNMPKTAGPPLAARLAFFRQTFVPQSLPDV